MKAILSIHSRALRCAAARVLVSVLFGVTGCAFSLSVANVLAWALPYGDAINLALGVWLALLGFGLYRVASCAYNLVGRYLY